MTYNLDEELGDNHYNCPVVAYYPEVLGANMPALKETHIYLATTSASTGRDDFSAKHAGHLQPDTLTASPEGGEGGGRRGL